MKAVEYYELYKSTLAEGADERTALERLLQAMAKDAKELFAARHCTRPSSIKAVIEELNGRWNALRRFDKGFIRDGFLNFMKERAEEEAKKKEAAELLNVDEGVNV